MAPIPLKGGTQMIQKVAGKAHQTSTRLLISSKLKAATEVSIMQLAAGGLANQEEKEVQKA